MRKYFANQVLAHDRSVASIVKENPERIKCAVELAKRILSESEVTVGTARKKLQSTLSKSPLAEIDAAIIIALKELKGGASS